MANKKSAGRTPLEQHVARVLSPFQAFIHDASIGSAILFICVVIALVIANSPWADAFWHLIETYAVVEVGDHGLQGSLHHWVNDGLMVLFFFVIGLEIKRELLVGELKDMRRAVPVVAAALGGMLAPALIYAAFNAGGAGAHGWGIPMATDTAFAVGVLALLGRGGASGLAAFLTALAIIDDMGAVAVIAIFYTDTLSLPALAVCVGIFAALLGLNVLGVRRPAIYLLGGIALWIAMLQSGVHTTVAGILAALAIPARPRRAGNWLPRRVRRLMTVFEGLERKRPDDVSILADQEQHAVIERLQQATEQASTPLQRWEQALERPVALFVLPLFALMNAGVALNAETVSRLWTDPLALGIIFGLVAGKTIGITGGAWLALRSGLGRLPADMTLRHVAGIGLLGGMGFTMSIFIAGLGLGSSDEATQTAKVAIIFASLLAGVGGYLWLRMAGPAQAAAE